MSSKRRKWSGNHGGNQQVATQTAAVTSEARRGLVPQESKTAFVVPHVPPIKKSPSIKDVLAEPKPNSNKSNEEENDVVSEQGVKEPSPPQPEKFEDAPLSNLLKPVIDEEELESEDEILERNDDTEFEEASVPEKETSEHTEFADQWNQMLDVVFASMPSVHLPLKDMLPKISDNVMHINVASSIQQKNIEQKRREMLGYFHTYCGLDLLDIIVKTSETAETKKVIYDNHDKYEYLKSENPEIQDFMDILGAKIST